MSVEALREQIVHTVKMSVERRAPDIGTLCHVFYADIPVTVFER